MATSDSRIHAVGVSQTRHRLHTHLTTAGAEFTKDDETSPEKPSSAWISVAIVSLGLLLVTTSGIAFYAFHETSALRDDLTRSLEAVEIRLQRMDATVGFDSKRHQLLLGVRDEILATNEKLSLYQAYRYSEFLLRATDKYPSVDPLMLVAMGIVESGFDRVALSHADARGLYQIWPATGRMLARILAWEYSDELLYDSEANTEMAALYLDILGTAYHDWSMILAEYNGGPMNAGYMRAQSNRAAPETVEYVSKVLENYDRLRDKFGSLQPVDAEAMHRSRDRDGKSFSSAALSTGVALTRTALSPSRGAP